MSGVVYPTISEPGRDGTQIVVLWPLKEESPLPNSPGFVVIFIIIYRYKLLNPYGCCPAAQLHQLGDATVLLYIKKKILFVL